MKPTVATSNDRMVRANGVDLCVEMFGDRADSAILLIHGAAASMRGWEVVDHLVALLRVFDGGTPHFDAASMRDALARDVDRTVNVASSLTNHFLIDVGEPIRPRLAEIEAPTPVI